MNTATKTENGNVQSKSRRDNKWDTLLESVVAKGEWVLIATEGGRDATESGIAIPNPKRDPYSRVVSVGHDVPKGFVTAGDTVQYKEGFNAMPKGMEGYPSRTYTWCFWKHVLGGLPEGTELPRF